MLIKNVTKNIKSTRLIVTFAALNNNESMPLTNLSCYKINDVKYRRKIGLAGAFFDGEKIITCQINLPH
jgi:hypothetical protein